MTDKPDDYLWDGSGEPDRDVERLERALSTYRAPLPPLPRRPPPRAVPPAGSVASIVLPLATAAAVVTLVALAAWYSAGAGRAGYAVAAAAGSPRVSGGAIEKHGRLRPGEWLETDAASRATIEVGAIGRVDVESNTRVQMIGARAGEHRLSLAEDGSRPRSGHRRDSFSSRRRRRSPSIWAAPTRSTSIRAARAFCACCMDGSGSNSKGRESFIPEQAVCRTRPGVGPGRRTSRMRPRSSSTRLTTIDFGDASARRAAPSTSRCGAAHRRAQLGHLLTRVDPDEVGPRVRPAAELVPPPAGVTRDGIARRQPPDAGPVVERAGAAVGLVVAALESPVAADPMTSP